MDRADAEGLARDSDWCSAAGRQPVRSGSPCRRGRGRGAQGCARRARSSARTRSWRRRAARGREVVAVAEVADELRWEVGRRRRHLLLRTATSTTPTSLAHSNGRFCAFSKRTAVAEPAGQPLPPRGRRDDRAGWCKPSRRAPPRSVCKGASTRTSTAVTWRGRGLSGPGSTTSTSNAFTSPSRCTKGHVVSASRSRHTCSGSSRRASPPCRSPG